MKLWNINKLNLKTSCIVPPVFMFYKSEFYSVGIWQTMFLHYSSVTATVQNVMLHLMYWQNVFKMPCRQKASPLDLCLIFR